MFRRHSKLSKIFLLNISTLRFINKGPFRPLTSCFYCDGRFRCANTGEWHILHGQPHSMSIDRITPCYRQVVFQFSIINFTNRNRKYILSTPPQLTACHKWHRTTSHYLPSFFYKICTMRNFLDKISVSTTYVISP